MTKITVTDTALKAGEPWAFAPVVVDLCDSNGDPVYPAYVTSTGVLVETFTTAADGDGLFTLTLDPTDDIAPTGCLYSVTIGDADAILINGDQGSGTVRGLRSTTATVLGNTATLDGLSNVNTSGKADGDALVWDTATGKWIAQAGGAGGVTSVSGTAPITSTGGTTPAIGISAATTGAAGSMSATDKAKLDGIEAGATADQTANEILAAVKTVDGTGSGLDADTVDGQHASAFEAAGAVSGHVGATDPHGDRAYAAGLVDDLSGVSNAATARSNLGLGDSATKNVGTTAGTVAAGDHNHSGAYDPAGTAAGLVDDLSGVSNATTARTNLGLGSAAVVDTGTGATNAILGNDARLTDSRAPSGSAGGDLSGTYPNPSVVAASTTTAGKVELATTAEATAGTDTSRAVVATGVAAAVSAYNAFAYL